MTLPDLSLNSLLVTVPLLLLVAVAVGGFNAIMIGALKVSPVIATIATLGIVQGIAHPDHGTQPRDVATWFRRSGWQFLARCRGWRSSQ